MYFNVAVSFGFLIFLYFFVASKLHFCNSINGPQIVAGVLRGFSTHPWQFYLSAFVDMGTRSEGKGFNKYCISIRLCFDIKAPRSTNVSEVSSERTVAHQTSQLMEL